MKCGGCGTFGLRSVSDIQSHGRECPKGRGAWAHVIWLKSAKRIDEAGEVVRDVLGIKGPEMTEEQKAYLREYSKTPEAKERARANRVRRMIAKKAEERRAVYAGKARRKAK